jgi:hypothetical protein
MIKIPGILFLILLQTLTVKMNGQTDNTRKALLKSIEYSNPDLLAPPGVDAPGFPVRDAGNDLFQSFLNPPPGYGEVPFWWWSGDKLDKERLLWQIEELHKKGITGMQINYIHKDSPGWPTYPADPEIFSDKWWEIWKYAAGEASKRSMGIGMSGYTIDWPKSDNLFNKIIYSIKEIQGLEILADTFIRVPKGGMVKMDLPEDLLMVWSYDVNEKGLVAGGRSLMKEVKNRVLTSGPVQSESEIWIYALKRQPGTINPVHPLSGQTVIDKFFQPFENNAGANGAAGLNYFFQDELKFGVGDIIWTDDLNDEFKKQKGYDLFTVLPALFRDIGAVTPKARLDFMDVKVRLTEERYFKPIFEWHWKRGKIYGCDPEGRGKSPGEYGDNFRAIRWYTAPGHDTPNGHADLIKGKVSSSIAALYRRPRVWLEGYHSLGWGATPEQIMYATSENFLYGCNLLNLHGLYYSTFGSYWEWAPPCYHFRMPYWDHMSVFLKYFERLSWLMSNSVLQADIAILYPVSTAQAKMGEESATSLAFETGTQLFNNGYDFMFIDDQSVTRAELGDGHLNVTDQSFKVLVLPSMKAIRWTTIERALEFYHNGGIVIACGSLPEASDNAGSSDVKLDAVVRELFGVSAGEMINGKKPSVQKDKSGGIGLYATNHLSILEEVKKLLPRHIIADEKVRYAHRRSGSRDIYMVLGANKGSWCSFRSTGKVESLDPWTGRTKTLTEIKVTPFGTAVRMPLDSIEAQIIVFSPVNELQPVTAVANNFSEPESTLLLDGDWEFELKPTMDNRWGDFRLPVTEKMIGAEARIFRYSEETGDPEVWRKETYGFGQKFWKLGPLPDATDQGMTDKKLAALNQINPSEPVVINGKPFYWIPYSFSWRYGVEGDPGHQGFHGLKEEITDEFICLGKPTPGFNETLYKTETEGSLYYLWTSAYAENVTNVTIEEGGLLPAAIYINGKESESSSKNIVLKKGSNPLLLKYTKPGRGHFVMVQTGYSIPKEETPLSMKWWNIPGRIPFDVRPGEEKPTGIYRFTAPPGLESFMVKTDVKISVRVDGEPVEPRRGDNSKAEQFVHLKTMKSERSEVSIIVEQRRGDYGGAAFPEPIMVNCGKGVIQTGDWAEGSILENYSGGAWYRKSVTLSDDQARSNLTIDLGNVVATAEVHVNDSLAGVVVTAPWRMDITPFVKKGENKIEILVYNTLANHYLTIPTKYRGPSLRSGLTGQVKLEFRKIEQ